MEGFIPHWRKHLLEETMTNNIFRIANKRAPIDSMLCKGNMPIREKKDPSFLLRSHHHPTFLLCSCKDYKFHEQGTVLQLIFSAKKEKEILDIYRK